MSLVISELPWPAMVIAYLAMAALVAGLVTLAVAIVRLALRPGAFEVPPADKGLTFFERAYKQQQREGYFLVAKQFRTERRLMGLGVAGMITGMAVMALLTLFFGR